MQQYAVHIATDTLVLARHANRIPPVTLKREAHGRDQAILHATYLMVQLARSRPDRKGDIIRLLARPPVVAEAKLYLPATFRTPDGSRIFIGVARRVAEQYMVPPVGLRHQRTSLRDLPSPAHHGYIRYGHAVDPHVLELIAIIKHLYARPARTYLWFLVGIHDRLQHLIPPMAGKHL